ncbi:MAG: exonuclease SbcCD subunit D [Actinobacteria bacterium]|nr:exonuclease SbcCD subunit D [Actinomycetota bacterium]
MRILHTSDWHLGRLFHGASLRAEHEQVLARVVELAKAAEVDVVVVAGDLYDRAIPPADAVHLFGDVLGELRAVAAHVVAVTGNHDSPARVGSLDPVLRAAGVTLRGRFAPESPVVVRDPAGGADVVIHPVPYVEPLALRGLDEPAAGAEPAASGGRGGDEVAAPRRRRLTQHAAMVWAMDQVRADLAGRAGVRSVVVAHTFVAGGQGSTSERELSVGDVDRVGLDAFAGVDCVLLGHLHRAQEWDAGTIGYSGSLLPCSFAETGPKVVRIVEVDHRGVRAESVPLGVGRAVRTITGALDDLVGDPVLVDAEACWVRAVVTDADLPPRAMAALQARFPHAVALQHRPVPGTVVRAVGAAARRGAGAVSDLDLVLAFLAEQTGRAVTDHERELVVQALEAQRTPVDGDDHGSRDVDGATTETAA